MKEKKYLLIGLVFGIVMGWVLGFLRLPQLEKNCSFLLGFIAALAIVSLVLLLLNAWNRNFLLGLMGKKTVSEDSKSPPIHPFVWIILLGILVLGGVVGGLTVYRQTESFKLQIQNQDQKILDMETLLDSVKRNDLKPLTRIILEDVGEELKRNPGRRLSETTIARIADLSFSFKPYQYIQEDSLSKKALSPERGQLLQALVFMNIDSGSFAQIIQSGIFARADLRGARLKGSDLSGINLQEANLRDADLSGANLKGADLKKANLWGANLNQANLNNANLIDVELSWAQLNEATLRLANLNGANLTNAQLRKADLYDANFQRAEAGGALFNEANLTSVNFYGTRLIRANLSQANLSYSDLRKTNLSEADLVGARLNKALIDAYWLENLIEWKPTGVKELRENYTIVTDTFNVEKRPLYRLRKN